MYNSPYEEYMRNSLGYNFNPMMNMNQNNEIYEDENVFTYNQANIDNMYPEIYRIIYPMICKACMNVQENITEDLVSRITNEVYMNVENFELERENRESKVNNNSQNNKNIKADNISNRSNISNSSRQDTRVNNFLLRDLIKILVLRELLGNPGRPQRLPFRPPFGGGPNPGGPRPPFIF